MGSDFDLPSAPRTIDRGNFFGSRCVFAWTPAALFHDMAGGNIAAKDASASGSFLTRSLGHAGVGASFADIAFGGISLNRQIIKRLPVSILVIAAPAASNPQVCFSQRNGAADQINIFFNRNAGNISALGYLSAILFDSSGANRSFDASGVLDGKPHSFLIVFGGNKNATGDGTGAIYVDGVARPLVTSPSGAGATFLSDAQSTKIGNLAGYAGTGVAAIDPVYGVFVFDGQLGADAARELYLRPGQIFARTGKRINGGLSPPPPPRVFPSGIPTEAAVGTPAVGGHYVVQPAGIASSATCGTPSVRRHPDAIQVFGIASPGSVGTPSIHVRGVVFPTGIASSAALGTPSFKVVVRETISDTLELAETVWFAHWISERISERLAFGEGIHTGVAFGETLADSMNLSEALHWGFREVMSDSLALSESFAQVMGLKLGLSDALGLSDSLTPTTIVLARTSDVLSFGETLDPHFAITLKFHDGLILEAMVEDGEQAWICLALNTSNNAASLYDGYPFPHMAQFRGRTLMGNEQGLFMASGSTDNGAPFHATAATGFLDFGDSHAKRLRAIYVGHSSAGEVYIGTLTGNDRTKRWYKLQPTDGDFQTERAIPALGASARYWAIEIDAAEAFEIESIELLPVLSTRRVRG